MTGDAPADPPIRVRRGNDRDVRSDGSYVLYWMTATRRAHHNFGLDRALWWTAELDRPLLVLEAIRCGYRWASDRMHRFVLDGMAVNRAAFRDAGIARYDYVEPEPGQGSGLLETLAGGSAVVIADEFPAFFLPRMLQAASDRVDVRFEVVDSSGLIPLAASDRAFARAYDFRRFAQRVLPIHLQDRPSAAPLRTDRAAAARASLRNLVSSDVLDRWPDALDVDLATLPIDHQVGPVEESGGSDAGRRLVERFVESRLQRYADRASHPQADATSELSPHLHFGHVSPHQVFDAVSRYEGWEFDDLGKASGKRSGWWGMSADAEAFLDQLVTWRELSYNGAARIPHFDEYRALPEWARDTLEQHAGDERDPRYSAEEFETARTHDALWNAAQNQLRSEGRIHNYLRMLWGKKILEWSESPEAALEIMIELNNKYGLDGRNPNSYSGIFWILGRYDRPWGPERPIYGKIRYMTSKNTARKYAVDEYIAQYSDGQGALL